MPEHKGLKQYGKNDKVGVLKIWKNKEGPDRAGFTAAGTFVALDGNSVAA